MGQITLNRPMHDWTGCAAIVQRADPWRFRCTMAAPLSARAVLFPIYAFNVEVSRAPWVTREPMIAEMRLQWWRDVLAEIAGGGPVRRHEVATPLARLLDPAACAVMDALIEARRGDIHGDPPGDLNAYLDATAGGLMWVAARALGAADDAAARGLGCGQGLAAYLRAVAQLDAAGHRPLADRSDAALRALARGGLSQLQQRGGRGRNPALWPAAGARAALRAVLRDPGCVLSGTLPETQTAWRLTCAVLFGRV